MSRSCIVAGCKSEEPNKELNFFKVPGNPTLFARWMDLIGREELRNNSGSYYFVCSKHFEPGYICTNPKRTCLRKGAEPLLNLPSNQGASIPNSDEIKHENAELEAANIETDKNKPTCSYTESQARQKSLSELQKFHELSEKFLNQDIATLVNKQAELRFNGFGKLVVDKEFFCLKLFYSNPFAYAMLQQQLNLPPQKDLAELLAPFITEDHEAFMKILKSKVRCMTDREKWTSVSVRVVPVKKHLYYNIGRDKILGFHEINHYQIPKLANYAVIVMAQGILENWHLPVNYALLSNKDPACIVSSVKRALTILCDIGLNVRLFISELDHDMFSLTRDMNIAFDKPFFVNEDQVVLYLHNIDDLIWKLRLALMEDDIIFGTQIAAWDNIVKFYQRDAAMTHRISPELSETHLETRAEDISWHDRKHICQQIFNDRVAAGISVYAQFKYIERSASGTAQFIALMSKLIQYMNSSTVNIKNEMNKVRSNNILQEALSFFISLRVFQSDVDITSRIESINLMIISLKSILVLTDDLISKGYSHLPMKNITTSALDEFCRQLRGKNGKSPSSKKFISAFKNSFHRNVMKVTKHEENVNNFFDFLEREIKTNKQMALGRKQSKILFPIQLVKRSHYKDLELPSEHKFMYLCAYVLQKTVEYHGCTKIVKYVRLNLSDNTSYNIYEEFRKRVTMHLPVVPRDTFIMFLQRLEILLQNFFCVVYLQNKRHEKLMISMLKHTENISLKKEIGCNTCCNYIKVLYARIKLFISVATSNKNIKDGTQPNEGFQYAFFI